MKRFLARWRHSARALLRAIDILACAIWLGALYPFGLASRPSGREMISSYVGEAAFNGHRWGRIAAAAIDRLFEWLGEGPGHCQRVFIKYRYLDD